MVSPLL